eukprot:1195629-Prorocentrum_minimum.AAC.7
MLRFPPGESIFTDGSLIAEVGVGAAYYSASELTDQPTYVTTVHAGEDIINDGEPTGLLQPSPYLSRKYAIICQFLS